MVSESLQYVTGDTELGRASKKSCCQNCELAVVTVQFHVIVQIIWVQSTPNNLGVTFG